jgi:hypothetical protein
VLVGVPRQWRVIRTGAAIYAVGALAARCTRAPRVEAVPQYGHWESCELAGTVPLARLGAAARHRAQPLFYSGTLAPAAYHAWLAFNAVRYVAISEAVPDSAARAEARLIRVGQP